MKKGTGTKSRISLTLDKDLVDELNDLCEKKFMKVSPFVEHLIRNGLGGYKKK